MNICFSNLNSYFIKDCSGPNEKEWERCCCYEDSYHYFPTCCSCSTYWWIWAIVAISILSTIASILVMFLRKRKRLKGYQSENGIPEREHHTFLEKESEKIQKNSENNQKNYKSLSEELFHNGKKYIPPRDDKDISPRFLDKEDKRENFKSINQEKIIISDQQKQILSSERIFLETDKILEKERNEFNEKEHKENVNKEKEVESDINFNSMNDEKK